MSEPETVILLRQDIITTPWSHNIYTIRGIEREEEEEDDEIYLT